MACAERGISSPYLLLNVIKVLNMNTNNNTNNSKTTHKPRANSPYKRKENASNRNKQNTGYMEPLVLEALDFINKHQDNNLVFGCFHKRNGRLETFGVYNGHTKKHSIHYVNNFFSNDFMDIKVVALAR